MIRRSFACLALLVLALPAGAAGPVVEGKWKAVEGGEGGQQTDIVTFERWLGSMKMSTASGVSYKAPLDGRDAPVKGDPTTTTVSVRMPAQHIYEETSKKDGKEWLVMKMEVQANNRVAVVNWMNLRNGKSGAYRMERINR